MSSIRQTRLGCYYCNEFLVGKRADDAKKNCFGFAYGPFDNPFLLRQERKVQFKPPTDAKSLQSLLLKCGHLFHKGCVRKSTLKDNGCANRLGKCPICKKPFLLGKGIDVQLKVPEESNIALRRKKILEENETKRLSIRADITRLQSINLAYEKGFDKARQSIMSDSQLILRDIREARQRKRLLEEYQRKYLDPLEDTLDEIYEENVLWKQLLGEEIPVDENGFFVPRPMSRMPSTARSSAQTEDGLPGTPSRPRTPLTPRAKEYFRMISSPVCPPTPEGNESDYSELWNQIPNPSSSSEMRHLRPDPDLLPNGLYEELTPGRDSDDDYDIGKFSEEIRKKILKQEVRNQQRQIPIRVAFEKAGIPISASGKFVYKCGCAEGNKIPLPEEHWEDSGSELVSDYALDGTSVYGSADLENRCDLDNILDPDRALRKWYQLMAVTLKFCYKFEQRKINWENFPQAGPMSDTEEEEILDFINNNHFHL